MSQTALLSEAEETASGSPDPQRRATIEAFLIEAKPWALRQARRRFPHIPDDLYEDVYQQACIEMWQRGPDSLDTRSLYAYLAKVLTGTLGRAHKSWVHDHAELTYEDGEPIPLADSGPEPDSEYGRRHLGALLSELMNRRLLAPERAVLQLQLGAGLDPDQVRRALDMTPRQYKRRRAEGLEKLRGALDDYLQGRVCEDHAGLLALAATGDLPAGSAEQLHAHLEHCGGCRAEMRRLRSTVRGRFAAAPWPAAITAPGWLATKLGGVGAALGADAVGGGVAKLAVVGAAAVAGVAGTSAVVVAGDDVPERSAERRPAQTADPRPPASDRAQTTASAPRQESTQPKRSRDGGRDRDRRTGDRDEKRTASSGGGGGATADGRSRSTAGEPSASAPTSASSPVGQAGDTVTGAVRDTTGTVRDTTGTVRDVTRDVTESLPSVPAPAPDVGQTVDQVGSVVEDTTGSVVESGTRAVDDAAGAVGGLVP